MTMTKPHITLLIILSSVFFSAGAIAQNKPLACQSDATAGLKWKNGRWDTVTFNGSKFILVQTKEGLTKESAAKALRTPVVSGVLCKDVNPEIFCTDRSGGYLWFHPVNLKGGVSQLIGASMLGEKKDTLSVSAFSCTPF